MERSDQDLPQGAGTGEDTPDSTPAAENEHRTVPRSAAFRAFIARDWAARPDQLPPPLPAAPYAARRRDALAAQFPGQRLVLPAGSLTRRSNDTDFRFRAHSAFAHLTGLGGDREPDAVLVLEPRRTTSTAPDREAPGPTHDAILYFRPRAERDAEEFYADARYGELWVGVRQSLEEIEAETGIESRHLDELLDALAKDLGPAGDATVLRVIRDADADLTERLDRLRQKALGAEPSTAQAEAQADAQADAQPDASVSADAELDRAASELRLVKDDFEVEQMRLAVAATVRGFADIVRALPEASDGERGERVVEGVFALRARREGNGVGYETIAASGPHACTLHWIRNDGPVRPGDLILVDAGVEVDSLYTADVTRTLPIGGTFSQAQRRVYEAVLEAADAAFEVARPGRRFRELNDVAQAVIARRLAEWGLLPGSAEESIDPEGQFHRRWSVHGVSHHLGIDVHDCTRARREMYLDGVLEPGMIFTIEPGLYFREEDLLAPAELRGIGVRIEDDVLVTDDGCENLSAALPRTADEVEAWMRDLRR